jgi:hypothetical protein
MMPQQQMQDACLPAGRSKRSESRGPRPFRQGRALQKAIDRQQPRLNAAGRKPGRGQSSLLA